MRILLAHNAYLGQFQHFGPWLAAKGHEVRVLYRDEPTLFAADLLRRRFADAHQRAREQANLLQEVENAINSGLGAAEAAIAMRGQGFVPDIIIAHCGWGTGLFLKEVWPEAVYIAYHEWFYRLDPLAAPDQVEPLGAENLLRTAHNLARNMPIVAEFLQADACWSPNGFQAGQFPPMLREKIHVTHDGVDTSVNRPIKGAKIDFPWLDLRHVERGVTYVGRGFEPTRGFPTFMQAVKMVQERDAAAHVVVIGSNRVAYGDRLEPGDSWLHRMIDQLELDLSRIHFTGTLRLPDLRHVLACSSAHVYLTLPFVLSWSLGEAMAIGCPVICNDLPSTRALITDGENGFLVPTGNVARLAEKILHCLEHPEEVMAIRRNARKTIQARFEMEEMFSARLAFMEDLLRKRRNGAGASSPAPSPSPAGKTEPAGARRARGQGGDAARKGTGSRIGTGAGTAAGSGAGTQAGTRAGFDPGRRQRERGQDRG